MNIDIEESLIESWLHITKRCQMVQNKWTISTTWDEIDKEILKKRKEDVIHLINTNEYVKVIIGKRYIDTVFKQAECDLIGINYNLKNDNYYIVETAFHEKGLHYTKNGEKDNSRVYKKLLIEGLIFYTYIAPFINKNTNLYLIFASPKAYDLVTYKEDSDYKLIREILTNLFLKEKNIEINIDVIVNERFKREIYIPIIRQIKDNNINSELFIRSLKLIDIVDDEFRYTNILKTDEKVKE